MKLYEDEIVEWEELCRPPHGGRGLKSCGRRDKKSS